MCKYLSFGTHLSKFDFLKRVRISNKFRLIKIGIASLEAIPIFFSTHLFPLVFTLYLNAKNNPAAKAPPIIGPTTGTQLYAQSDPPLLAIGRTA